MKEFLLIELLKLMEEKDASDIHLQVGSYPILRMKGHLSRLSEFPLIEEAILKTGIYKLLKEKDIKIFEEKGTLDTSIGIPETGRFRTSIFLQRGTIALVARRISNVIPDFESLNLPEPVSKISNFINGLVLVTGPTGSGKSSTLAAVVNYINKNRSCHILCIEDPIEFLYKNEKAIITQREIGIDVNSFQESLKYAVRQDPDVILAGEMRDEDTVKFALHGAETGHLVFGTLHSSNATQTIGRILNFFPQTKHYQIRKSLSLHLRTIISQILLPSTKEGVSRIPACEIMFTNPIISRLISEDKDEKIIKVIKGGKNEGMQDFEQAIFNLVNNGFITEELALKYAENPQSLEMKFKGIFLKEEGGIIK